MLKSHCTCNEIFLGGIMKGKLIFSPFDESSDYFYTEVSSGMSPYDYEISLRVPLGKSFEEIISNPLDFDESIDLSMDVFSDNEEQVKFLELIKNNRVCYLKNA